jgi:hypothetical protein
MKDDTLSNRDRKTDLAFTNNSIFINAKVYPDTTGIQGAYTHAILFDFGVFVSDT